MAADLADVAGDAMVVVAAAVTSSPRCASMQALPALARTRSRSLMTRLVLRSARSDKGWQSKAGRWQASVQSQECGKFCCRLRIQVVMVTQGL